MRLAFSVDGVAQDVEIHPGETLMETLRVHGFTSVKDGCANGDCGSCAVLVDGRAVNACLLFTVTVEGKSITTAAGLAAPDGTLHPLQVALLEAGAVQCGFCTPGILMVAAELLAGKTTPSEEDVRWALAANLCRCTGYVKIIEGILAATAAEEAGDG